MSKILIYFLLRFKEKTIVVTSMTIIDKSTGGGYVGYLGN